MGENETYNMMENLTWFGRLFDGVNHEDALKSCEDNTQFIVDLLDTNMKIVATADYDGAVILQDTIKSNGGGDGGSW
jgi:hypothetical protein